MTVKAELAVIDGIAARITTVRGHRVILDFDLAALYGVETRRLNEQVARNAARFPRDFVFPMSIHEVKNLKSQFATSSWGGRRKSPHAFTEHGAIMAAMVLNSPRATEISVYVVRAFVTLRDTFASHRELAVRLDQLEKDLREKLAAHDETIISIIGTLRRLVSSPEPKKRRIGFV